MSGIRGTLVLFVERAAVDRRDAENEAEHEKAIDKNLGHAKYW